MSEYQYYEFLAADRPLGPSDITALRALSSRAKITPTHFTNVYNFGDFKGSPEKLMEKYFDAHTYVANWGTRRLMLRIPICDVDGDALASYVVHEVLDCRTTEKHLIIQWQRDEESGDSWVESEGWMARLLPLREELRRGDYRALYIGWLYGVSVGAVAEDAIEPLVPEGLRSPTAAQTALADFLGIDNDLLAAAALASPSAPDRVDSEHAMAQWVSKIPTAETRRYLLLLLQGKAQQAGHEMEREYAIALRASVPTNTLPPQERRTVAKLLELAEEARKARRERQEKKKQWELAKQRQERERYLAAVAKDFERYWKEISNLVKQQTSAAYDQIRDLLIDLSEASSLAQKRDEFLTRLNQFRATHARKSALIRRLNEVGKRPSLR